MPAHNEGKIDRTIRVILGVGLLGFGLVAKNPVGFVGLVPLLTGAVGFCPLYRLIGLQTCTRTQTGA
ncbi:MAG TPA: DUF2892 domain-containing protein [Polyangiales bacterium]|jgi:hypothetical protein